MTNVWGFNKIREKSMQVIEMVELSLPAVRTDTQAIWFDVSPATKVLKFRFLCHILGSHAV